MNNTSSFLKWVFVESTAKWLFIILAFEYLVAVNLSPTILTDYPFFNWIVEILAFIPAVHNFDEIAVHPEAVRFYIVLITLLLIPKSASIYYFLKKNPIREMRQYVITPYTTTKPKYSHQALTEGLLTIEEIKRLPTNQRSMLSRVFWSLTILMFSLGFVFAYHYGVAGHPLQRSDLLLGAGFSLCYEFAFTATLNASMIAISSFIIKDYIRLFIELFRHRAPTSK